MIGRGMGSVVGATLVVAVVAVVAVARGQSAAPASADGGAAPAAAAVPGSDVDRPSPNRLPSLPSLYETGRIGAAPEAERTAIEPQEEINVSSEKSVDNTTADVTDVTAPAPRSGVVNQAVLDQQIANRFATLESCRADVARTKRVPPNEVLASTLTLRWTIRPNGATADTTVVATSPVDLDVMSCVKTALVRWKFTAPRGGPVRVERVFNFRALQ
jgi:hypothetical protein